MKKKLQGVIIGIVLMGLFYSYPVLASFVDKKITVQTGVSIYVNDNLLKPTDDRGNPVEPFIYNGTTYLPARAIANAFNTDIKWEGKTGSVFVGKHKSKDPAVLIQNLDYFTGSDVEFETSHKDNLGNNRTNVITEDFMNVYKINGKYASIAGTIFQKYADRSTDNEYTLKIYGDNNLLYEVKMNAGMEPIDFNIDVTGVLELKLEFDSSSNGLWRDYQTCAISNFGLYY